MNFQMNPNILKTISILPWFQKLSQWSPRIQHRIEAFGTIETHFVVFKVKGPI